MNKKIKNLERPVVIEKAGSDVNFIIALYSPKIIISILLVFLCFRFLPIKLFPDYFSLNEIENFRPFVWSLFTVTLGFSGLILTLLLLSYNFYVKSIKRKTLEFIFENIYLRILFSGFFGIVLVQLIAYFLISNGNRTDVLASVYFLLLITATYILLQLPLAMLGLRYSTSITKITKILSSIDSQDVDYLVNPNKFLSCHPIEEIEGNRIIILKNIGVNAIKEGDWILPQKILNGLYELIPLSLKECPIAETQNAVFVLLWISKHFQQPAIKHSDQITLSVIDGQISTLYYLLAEHKIYKLDYISSIDNFYKEFIISVIQSKDFIELRENWVRDYSQLMAATVLSLNFDDSTLPTDQYRFQNKNVEYPFKKDYFQFWHYVKYSQVDVLVDVVEFGMQQIDKRIYDTFHLQIRHLVEQVESSGQLTDSQKRSYVGDLFIRIGRLEDSALKYGLFEKIPVFSHFEIDRWLKKGWNEVYYSGMHQQVRILKKLIRQDKPYISQLKDFFNVGKGVCNQNSSLQKSVKVEILSFVIDAGLQIFEYRGESKQLEYDIQFQLNWLSVHFIEKNKELKKIKDKYGEHINKAIEGFDDNKRPY